MNDQDLSGEMTLQPGMLIRPHMEDDTAKHLVQELYGLKVKRVREMNSYDDKNYKILVEEDYTNPNIPQLWPHGYILKVLNSMDSRKKHVDGEHGAQRLFHEAGIPCPQPVLDLQGRDKSIQKIYHNTDKKWRENIEGENGPYGEHIVRLLTFIPGKMLVEVPYKPLLLFKAGQFIGNIEKTLKEKAFSHPALTNHQTVWSLSSVPRLSEFLHAVQEESRRHLVADIIHSFDTQVLPKLDQFQKGIIHGDFNEQNILVLETADSATLCENEKEHNISGVIDFGDMLDSYYVFEIAITIMYMMVESKVIDPLLVGGHVLAGYFTKMELSDVEFSVLKTCVAARFCQSLVMGAYSYLQDPGNEYLLVTAANGWPQLKKLWDTPQEKLYSDWRKIIDEYKS